MVWRVVRQLYLHAGRSFLAKEEPRNLRFITTTSAVRVKQREIRRDLAVKDKYFDQETKNKQTFLELLELFKSKEYKTGHIEFIYAALNRMDEYGVEEDLECYKQIMDVMPKGKMMGSNSWLTDFHYYPKHQDCLVDVLLKMEANRIMPDREMYDILVRTFGKKSSPTLKVMRMLYWYPKMKYASPWPPPEPRPESQKEAAILAVKRMCSVDPENEITVFHTKDDELSVENTWIVNGQSPVQKTLLKYHPENMPMYVEGPFKMHLGRKDIIEHFILRADMPKNRRRRKLRDPDDISNLKIPFFDPPTSEDLVPEFSVHEQKDGIIYATVSIGSPCSDSLHSWIRFLQKNGNPKLENILVVFPRAFSGASSDQLKLAEKKNEDSEEKKENE